MSYNRNQTQSTAKIYPNKADNFELHKSQTAMTETETSSSDEPKSRNKDRICQTIFDAVAIVIIFVVFLLVYLLVDPNISYFYCNDTDVMYPYKSDTVAFWVVGIYGCIAPVISILLVELKNSGILNCFSSSKDKTSAKEKVRTYFVCIFHALSLFVLGIAITLLITEVGKRWIGRLRPHFMDVCQPIYSSINCSTTSSTLVYTPVYTGGSFCTGNSAKIKEARLSFPSGHSSFSCYTMLFLILYLEARLDLLRIRYIKSLIQLGAFIAAYITCISRVSDYHHRGSDVIGGAIIGIVIGLYIPLITGKVLWKYKSAKKVYEFDLER